MDNINLSNSLNALDLSPQQPAPQDLPPSHGFAGHSVNVGAGATNMPSPPPYSLHDPQQRHVYPCPPPAYTPLAATPGQVSGAEIPASLEDCLFTLEQAYETDFTELTETLSHVRASRVLRSPFHTMASEVLNPDSQEKNSSKNLLQLAKTIWTFFSDEYSTLKDTGSYSLLSQLTVVTCMYFLEQKFKPEHQTSTQKAPDNKARPAQALTDGENLLPALVRKTFFQQLLSAADRSHRGDAEIAINKFVQNNRSGLQADLDSPHPVNGNLKFSGMRYEDIPGTTISKQYRPQLDAYSRYYSIDLSGLVEALGQTNCARYILQDPLEKVMRKVARETKNKNYLPNAFFHNQAEPFRDRNARCLLALINYCQNQVSEQNSNTADHEAPEMGEKCNNDGAHPLQQSSAQQSSAGRQQDTQAVIDKLSALLISESSHIESVQNRLKAFFQ